MVPEKIIKGTVKVTQLKTKIATVKIKNKSYSRPVILKFEVGIMNVGGKNRFFDSDKPSFIGF